MQEILVLIVVALAIFYLPRVMGRRPAPVKVVRRPALSGWMRLAILMTVFWVGGSAVILKPWQGDPLPFLYTGLAPAAALWGSTWVWFGYRKHRR